MTEQLPKQPTVAVLDSDFFVYRIGFSVSDTEPDTIAKNRLTEWLTDIVYMNLQCDDYRAYITGSTNFRNDIAVTVPYKGNRKGIEKPVYYQALRDHLKRLGAVISEGQEADDCVAIDSTANDVWIVHVDKDLDQLPGWHYNPVKDEKYYVTAFEGLVNFYTQVLTGDRTDNIIGLKGIGPVKAGKILQDCKTEVELYNAVVEAYTKAGEPLERVEENANLLWLRRVEGQAWKSPLDVS